MPGPQPGELQKRQRIAALVGLPVGFAAVGCGEKRRVIGRGLRPRAGCVKTASHGRE